MDDKCNIVRDLMPLVIDEAASEDSVKYVENHTENCSECAAYYQGMRAMLPKTEAAAAEKKHFSRATKKLRHKRWKRVCAWVCVGVILTLLLLGAGVTVYNGLTKEWITPMNMNGYDVQLSRLKNGKCIFSIRQAEPDIPAKMSALMIPEADGFTEYLYLNTVILPQKDASLSNMAQWHWEFFWDWDEAGLYYVEKDQREPVTKVFKGQPGNCELVYQQGDEIPPASEEMERYFEAWDEYIRLIDMQNTAGWWDDQELQQNLINQHALTERLKWKVPEWKTYIETTDSIVEVMSSPTPIPIITPLPALENKDN